MKRIDVLDHGYVSLVEKWGSEEGIIEAARMSTGKGFLGWGVEETCDRCGGSGTNEPENGPGSLCKQCRGRRVFINKPGDEKLLRFLYENHHATPFEMAGMTIEVQAPIFVFREWHRHRTQSYNEMSARYTPMPDMNYVPTIERLMMSGGSNKQAQGIKDRAVQESDCKTFQEQLVNMYAEQQSMYVVALEFGIPKELARIMLPVGRYSRMRASTDLRNWLGFLTLRMASGAQWEIRQYANALHALLKGAFPRTLSLFEESNG